jgi:hypothetical protein
MKNLTNFYVIIGCLLYIGTGCHPETPTTDDLNNLSSVEQPSLRHSSQEAQKRLTVQQAFLRLPQEELILEGLHGLSSVERKLLLKTGHHYHYRCRVVGNYLEITEQAYNAEDEQEQLERFVMSVYNSLTKNSVVFISQSLVEEQRGQQQIIQQRFLEYQPNSWQDIGQQLPAITTKTFFEKDTPPLQNQSDHFYFDLLPTDVNYLQARLQYELYPNKDSTALREAYKVALVWTGNAFQLNRQPMVQYEISEYHSKQ